MTGDEGEDQTLDDVATDEGRLTATVSSLVSSLGKNGCRQRTSNNSSWEKKDSVRCFSVKLHQDAVNIANCLPLC